jgi:hypothetical protein
MKYMKGRATDKYFQKIGQNPLSWLGTAKRMKLSADVLLEHAIRQSNVSPENPNIVDRIAHLEAYMVLTGFAFENLLKGIDVAKDPNVVDADKLNVPQWGAGKGHGISTFAGRLANLSADEIDLFKRLEEYVIWVGRYPIPKSANTFSYAAGNTLTIIKESDPDMINRLFRQFSDMLVNEWEKHDEVV